MMRRRVAVVGALVAVVSVSLVLFGGGLGAQSEEDRLDEIAREIENLEARIAAAESQRSETVALLDETRTRLNEVRAALDAAQGQLDAILASIAGKEADIAELDRQIEVLTAQLGQTRVEQDATRRQVRDRAVDLYMNGVYGLGRVVFSVDDVANASVGLEYADNVLDNTSFLLRSLEVLENQEEAQQAGLEDRQEEERVVLAELDLDRLEAEEHRAEVDAIRAEVADELAQQEALLGDINSEIANHEDHFAALEREAAALEAEIAARQRTDGTAPGRLAWPVPGPVTSAFGYRIHPITGTRRLHAGIDLAGSSGQPIAAAGAGTVILAQTYGGYGNTIVIDHGGGLTTLYAHQSSLAVSNGQSVSTGDLIGYVGSTGFSTGPHLHFETREWGSPVDPMGYLSG